MNSLGARGVQNVVASWVLDVSRLARFRREYQGVAEMDEPTILCVHYFRGLTTRFGAVNLIYVHTHSFISRSFLS